ncbi:MAG: carbon-nitrogen hydrolase family protein [Undibacterium sp.]|uniref:carbon-nitrogen hydrolase family protein n=1 Tax=Undibacterium sp. TaxID=1914977 RepID=UPI00271C0023|nr:carbon-nitrogen hydrolase family protein [Undibacterium sp.]MDO8651795.1 carbon-nitrogen hydrolase family protein [Undibacterium sp.]
MKVAAIQMISTPTLAENLATATVLLQQARDKGAELLLLPEYWPVMGMQETDKFTVAEQFGSGVIQEFLSDTAQRLGAWIIGGTLPLISPNPDKVFNTSLVYNPQGEVLARYDKIHLFGFSKAEESYEESRTISAGTQVVSFDAGFGKVGLSVCYDLRFPELYRAMGYCRLIVVPAAFTHTTGQAHWEILLRARAIENQCYVLAAAQGGKHLNGRRTWGHSMLIDPWGKIIEVLDEGEGVVSGTLDLDLLQNVRASLPALKHRKLS